MPSAIANRYARALVDVVSQKGDYRQVRQELESFAAVYSESAELREVFDTPALPLTEKLKVLAAITGKMGTTSITTNFLSVLGQNYRMNLLEEICRAFHKLANDRLGVVEVKMYICMRGAEPSGGVAKLALFVPEPSWAGGLDKSPRLGRTRRAPERSKRQRRWPGKPPQSPADGA